MSILCRVTRGDLTESIHVAFASVIDDSGNIIYSSGDPYYLTCVRSALKPFQAAAVVHSGATNKYNFKNEEMALMCASHHGEKIHTNAVKSMLKKLNLTDKDLECGSHYPSNEKMKNDMIAHNKELTPIYNNCSGKHLGMLALSKYLDVNVKGYINKEHDVQKYIFRYLGSLKVTENIPLEKDGCSAPTPFMTLESIAKLYQMLAKAERKELKVIFDLMSKYPNYIGGTDSFDSLFNRIMKGKAVTKIGAESVRGISVKKEDGESIGIALKILDGNTRALSGVTVTLLEHLGLLKGQELEKLSIFKNKIIKNHNGFDVGRIEVVIEG